MNRALSLMLVGALFVTGVLIGVLGERVLDRRRGPDGPPGFGGRGGFTEMLQRRLDLTDDQRERIEQVLEQSHAEAEALRLEVEPRVRQQMERTHERLRALLTPEQQRTFEDMHRRGEMDRGFLGGGRHPRGGPPPRGRRPPGGPGPGPGPEPR